MQYPIGSGETFEGVIDLVTMQAIYFDGDNGETIRREAIPAELAEDARTRPRADARSAGDVQRRADGTAAVGRAGARGADPRA